MIAEGPAATSVNGTPTVALSVSTTTQLSDKTGTLTTCLRFRSHVTTVAKVAYSRLPTAITMPGLQTRTAPLRPRNRMAAASHWASEYAAKHSISAWFGTQRTT